MITELFFVNRLSTKSVDNRTISSRVASSNVNNVTRRKRSRSEKKRKVQINRVCVEVNDD